MYTDVLRELRELTPHESLKWLRYAYEERDVDLAACWRWGEELGCNPLDLEAILGDRYELLDDPGVIPFTPTAITPGSAPLVDHRLTEIAEDVASFGKLTQAGRLAVDAFIGSFLSSEPSNATFLRAYAMGWETKDLVRARLKEIATSPALAGQAEQLARLNIAVRSERPDGVASPVSSERLAEAISEQLGAVPSDAAVVAEVSPFYRFHRSLAISRLAQDVSNLGPYPWILFRELDYIRRGLRTPELATGLGSQSCSVRPSASKHHPFVAQTQRVAAQRAQELFDALQGGLPAIAIMGSGQSQQRDLIATVTWLRARGPTALLLLQDAKAPSVGAAPFTLVGKDNGEPQYQEAIALLLALTTFFDGWYDSGDSWELNAHAIARATDHRVHWEALVSHGAEKLIGHDEVARTQKAWASVAASHWDPETLGMIVRSANGPRNRGYYREKYAALVVSFGHVKPGSVTRDEFAWAKATLEAFFSESVRTDSTGDARELVLRLPDLGALVDLKRAWLPRLPADEEAE